MKNTIFYGIVTIGVLIVGICVAAYFGGCNAISSVVRGNVYSTGYYDGYIQGCAEKADTIARLGRVYELKMGVHGYGSPVNPEKAGQFINGSWHANFFEEALYVKMQKIRGDTLVRVFYEEKDYTFEGATKYRITDVIVLPPSDEMKSMGKEQNDN